MPGQFLKESPPHGAREAIKVLDALEKPTDVSLDDASLEMLIKEIYNRINAIPYSEVMRLKDESDSEEKDIIRYAKDALNSFWKDITDDEG